MPGQIAEGPKNADLATTLPELGVNFAVQKSIGIELLERVAASESIARKLQATQDAQWPVQFSHVIQPAQPFLTAIIAHTWHRLPADDRQAADSMIWILCPSVHSQELFYESLLNWQSDALFLPEAEFAWRKCFARSGNAGTPGDPNANRAQPVHASWSQREQVASKPHQSAAV